ncbi:DUF4189 domain-containing protein [Stenotrophomonas sp.]|uniref:DUF4189 domain-containing protein n=1 Tax=Stenotrophomonas sp. TaxID=69392 RepID=UPI0028A9027D|nr:DUF4189 domain-containing protein [Stenotrophomonas sp.]
MKRVVTWIAWILLIPLGVSSGRALAEGGSCPPGYYPIGGQGAQRCAPIPTSGGSAGSGSQEIRLSTPTGRWVKTWGAIATSMSSDDAGVSDGKRTKAEAEKLAVERCGSTGAKDCVVSKTYHNQCVSWLVPKDRNPNGQGAIGTGGTPEFARMYAQSVCKNSVPGPCDEVYANCTKPIFEEF